MDRRPLALALTLSALAAAGCGLGAGDSPDGARLLVTDGFGAAVLTDARTPETGGSDTVMRLLQRNADVSTRYGGGFVQAIDGRAGGTPGGRPVDWFYYVNGVLAAEGGASTRVRAGDAVWWDRHDWGTGETKAVVGSFPEPFLHGAGGRLPAVRLECAARAGAACAVALARLRAVGVTATRAPFRPTAASGRALRVLVGTYATLRRDVAVRTLEAGPRVSGVYARLTPSGAGLATLDARGRVQRRFTTGAGLVAATVREGGSPIWMLTGTDDAGVAAAAGSLRPAALGHHFAVVVTRAGVQPLPGR